MRAHQLAALAAASTLTLAACGGASVSHASGPGPMPMPMPAASSTLAAPVAAISVAIKNFAFSPQAITVKAGTEVTWTNDDADAHTVTFDADHTGSLAFQNGESYRHTFSTPGIYRYHCSIHPYMVGEVIVSA
jgi:plastocyanin